MKNALFVVLLTGFVVAVPASGEPVAAPRIDGKQTQDAKAQKTVSKAAPPAVTPTQVESADQTKGTDKPKAGGDCLKSDYLCRTLDWFWIALSEPVNLFTATLTVFTIGLWVETRNTARATKESAVAAADSAAAAKLATEIAKKTMVASNRAFMRVDNIVHIIRPDPTNPLKKRYYFAFKWINGGNTPTKNAITHVSYISSSTPIDDDFIFASRPDASGHMMVGPNASMTSPSIPGVGVGGEDLLDNFYGRKFMYIWGWVKYLDVFDGTAQHVTRFCFQIYANLTPQEEGAFDSVDFNYSVATKHNCADEECTYI